MSRSLCHAISGSVKQADFARFEQEFLDPSVASLLSRTPAVTGSLELLLPYLPEPKEASAPVRLDVLQLIPEGYGYTLKWAAAPDGAGQPQTAQISAAQAQKALPKQMVDTADQQGAATVTSVQAEPDPMTETPAPAQTFGVYKVYEADTGNPLMGYVIPGLFDPVQGRPTPQTLFTNGSAYALQPAVNGVLTSVSFNLPGDETEPRGLGVFYKTDGKTLLATVPYTVMSRVTIEDRSAFSAQSYDGQAVQITPSEGIRKPVATSPTEIVIPADYLWLPLNNQIELAGEAGQDVGHAAKQAAVPTMMEVRAWADGGGHGGGCRLGGPVFEKVGSGTHSWVDGIFYMAAAGVPQNLATAVLEKAASAGEPLRLYGCQPLGHEENAVLAGGLGRAVKTAMISRRKYPPPQSLLRECVALGHDKEARALVGVDSVDNLLALNFINSENVQTFVEYLPELEETSSKLASLVMATQLGLQGVPRVAAERAMTALESVIVGLRSLQKHEM